MSKEQVSNESTGGSSIEELIFVGFNARVVAIDRYTGEIKWTWKAPKGTNYANVLLDGDRLIVGVNGFMYCLDPIYGQEVWNNPMKGLGLGVTSITSVRAQALNQPIAVAAIQQAQQQSAAT